MTFCADMQLPASPATQETVTLFVAYLGAQRISVSTIQSYLAALRHSRLTLNPTCTNPSFLSPHLKVLIRGIKRVNAAASTRVRLPITASVMRRIKDSLASKTGTLSALNLYSRTLLWAACCVGFFGFLRTAEFLVPDNVPFTQTSHLSMDDVPSIDPPTHGRYF